MGWSEDQEELARMVSIESSFHGGRTLRMFRKGRPKFTGGIDSNNNGPSVNETPDLPWR